MGILGADSFRLGALYLLMIAGPKWRYTPPFTPGLHLHLVLLLDSLEFSSNRTVVVCSGKAMPFMAVFAGSNSDS